MTNSSVELFENLRKSELLQEVDPPIIIADNLRTPDNMGMILRLAANINAPLTLFLLDEDIDFKLSKIKRTSSGASEKVKWKIIKSSEMVQYLPEGYSIVALETCDDSENLFSFIFPKKIAIIVGNEVVGIRKKILEKSNYKVFIPIPGKLSSLNVTHALSIALFSWVKQIIQ
jgi:tRNA G18 (ribose-2'-O)-methylase SpoU